MIPTHRKKAYKAECTRWMGEVDKVHIMRILKAAGVQVTMHNSYLMLRFTDDHKSIDTMSFGDWIVIGENGFIKRYTNEIFNVKYEEKCNDNNIKEAVGN